MAAYFPTPMYTSSEKKIYLSASSFCLYRSSEKKSIKERVMADVLNGILKLPVFVSTGDMMDDDSFTSMNLNFHKSITKRF